MDVLHVMASDLRRGGQAETRTICNWLDSPARRHLAVTLFESPAGHLAPDVSLAVADGWPRRAGFDPRAALALRRTVTQRRPRVVVAHGSEALKYTVLVPRSTVVVYHKIGVVTHAAERNPRRWFHRLLLRRPSMVVAVSSDTATDAARFGRADAVVVPNCREPAPFLEIPLVPPDSATLRTIFVGQLMPSKQPDVYVQIVRRLREQGVEITGTVVGDGPMLDELAGCSADGIEFLGSRSDVSALLAEHAVLVFTSRSEGEGMPGVLIEAGLAARPTVAFDGPGVRDVVLTDRTGVVIEQGDIASMASTLEHLAADRQRVAELGSAARDHCSANFDVAVVGEQWREVLDGASQRPGRRSRPPTP